MYEYCWIADPGEGGGAAGHPANDGMGRHRRCFLREMELAHREAQRTGRAARPIETSSVAATLARMARVVATYTLPLPVNISADCFETSIDAVIAGYPATLTTPLVRWTDEGRFVVQPPQVSDLPHQPDDGDDIFWGKIGEWQTDPPQFSEGWLRAVAFTFDVDEESIGSRPGGARWRPTGPVIDGLFDLVPVWFDLLLRWIGVVSDQDTFVDTPRVLPTAQGEGLSVRAVTLAGPSESVWPTSFYLWRTEALAVSRETFEDVVRATSRGIAPPPAHLLVRDARADMARENRRKAVIGAGPAVELALSDWSQTPPPPRGRPRPFACPCHARSPREARDETSPARDATRPRTSSERRDA